MWGLLAMAAVLMPVAACAGGSTAEGKAVPVATSGRGGSRASTTTTEPASTTTTLPVIPGVDPTLEATVWQAYLAANDAVMTASADPDPRNPVLSQHLTNTMLNVWQQTLSQQAADGDTASYPPNSVHRARLYGVRVRNANWVDLDLCNLDDAVVRVKATGQVVNDKVSLIRTTATMWLENGTWHLAGADGRQVEVSECPGF